jgi:hypothetical protein
MSLPPASARNSSATTRLRVSPKPTIAAPHIRPAQITTRPGRRTRPVQPLVAAPAIAPAAGAAVSRPNVAEPPWKCLVASAGKSPAGMPNSIALVSISSMPPSTPSCRTCRKPSANERNPGRCTRTTGGSGRTNSSASEASTKHAASTP